MLCYKKSQQVYVVLPQCWIWCGCIQIFEYWKEARFPIFVQHSCTVYFSHWWMSQLLKHQPNYRIHFHQMKISFSCSTKQVAYLILFQFCHSTVITCMACHHWQRSCPLFSVVKSAPGPLVDLHTSLSPLAPVVPKPITNSTVVHISISCFE